MQEMMQIESDVGDVSDMIAEEVNTLPGMLQDCHE